MAVSRGSCRGRVLWRPYMPHPMLAMPSHAISCTPIPPWSSSKYRNTPSTNQLHVFAFQVGRLVWLNKDYCLNRQGGNAWNLFDFDNQSAAFFCVDTIKYYSIPSVPSHLEGVKTRPDVLCHNFEKRRIGIISSNDRDRGVELRRMPWALLIIVHILGRKYDPKIVQKYST